VLFVVFFAGVVLFVVFFAGFGLTGVVLFCFLTLTQDFPLKT